MNFVDSAEKPSTGPRLKVYSAMTNHNNGETVLILELTYLLWHVSEEIIY